TNSFAGAELTIYLVDAGTLIFRLTALRRYVTVCNVTMNSRKKKQPKSLGQLEELVMEYCWSNGRATAEACRAALGDRWAMKDSTVRTILRRLEEKGFLTHEVQGRTFVYKPVEARQNVAARAVKQIIDRFCGGSVEQLLVGMVDNQVVDQKQLERLARKIAGRKGIKP